MTTSKKRLTAHELLGGVLDTDTFVSWDTAPVAVPTSDVYAKELADARSASGVDEAVITGEGTVRGRRVAVVACEFRFLGGTIGVAAAERLVRGIERATEERLPLLAAPVSGGTRMQEGTVAFLQMVKITQAVMRHRQSRLPYLVYLRHPTTGGVLASWGSLGHVTGAEPGALIGFLGPRVYEALYGEPFPEGVQLAENLYRLGVLDALVPPEDIAFTIERALDVMQLPESLPTPAEPEDLPVDDVPAWDSVERTRRPDRPHIRQLLRATAGSVSALRGTQAGERDPGLIFALAKFGAAPCVVLAQDRFRQKELQPLGPAALREARRGMRLAAELGLPLLTVIDTAGAALSKEAEEGGMAGEIARSLAELVTLRTPTLCLLLGEGAGGGALALLPADRVVAAQHAWLSPLPLEGASAILYRTTDRAPELAAAQGVRALDLKRNGIVDRIIAERPDAADEPKEFLARVGRVLEYELISLLHRDPAERMAERYRRFRELGLP